MHVLIVIVHLIVCFALILIVLLQTGKGASMGAMFGSAGNQTLFGNTGASTFLSKATTIAAVVFMITSLTLAYVSKSGNDSVISDYTPAAGKSQPPSADLPQGNTPAVDQTAPEKAPQPPAPADQQAPGTPDDSGTTVPANPPTPNAPADGTDEKP